MPDLLGLDPARITRLRSPERLADLPPERVWDVLAPAPDGAIVDVGAGVGYLTLPFARRFPGRTVYACDVLEGMLAHLREAADAEGLANVECVWMPAGDSLPLPDDCAAALAMAQVHHELDDPVGLLRECRRVLAPGAPVAIVDWKDEDNGKGPAPGRRVPEARIRADLAAAGFGDVTAHAVYRYHQFLTARA